LIDIGVNLTSRQFRRDRPEVIQRARQAGLTMMLVTGTNLAASKDALELCEQYPGLLFATAGVHPHDADSLDEAGCKELAQLATHPQCIAIGETGLDFKRNFSSQANQLQAFEWQLQLAASSGKPVFLHERDAFADQHRSLESYRSQLVGGVAHCFTGSAEQLMAYLELDLYIGITGWICDQQRGEILRSIVPQIPDHRLLLETDAPYLLPSNAPREGVSSRYRRRNEPALLPYVIEIVASLRQQSIEVVKQLSQTNAQRLFNLTGN
jgi:TatD DNase family protein